MIKQFRKKPVVIEAIQFDGTNKEEIHNFVGDAIGQDVNSKDLFITTLEGIMIASVGDYVIKGVQGEFYPCKPDIFEQTYNEVQENASDLITEVNVTELLKIAKQSEHQYNAVVKHKKENERLERELKSCNYVFMKEYIENLKTVLFKIKNIAEMAIKEMYATKSDDYTDGMKTVASYVLNELNELNEVL